MIFGLRQLTFNEQCNFIENYFVLHCIVRFLVPVVERN